VIVDPEAEFRRLIAIVRVLPTRFEGEVGGEQLELGVERHDFPACTALARAHWATAQYEPAVAVLADGRTVLGCMHLLRGLLELWADFLYITAKPDPVERRIRAVQMEIDTSREIVAWLQKGDAADVVRERSLAAVTDRLGRLEDIKRSEGWRVGGRRYGQVTQWLDRSGLEWPAQMYRGFSVAAHNRLPEWADDAVGAGTWHFRGVRLEQCVVIYSNILHLALELIRPDGDGTFDRAARGLLDDEVLRMALQGQLD
jgi:hypothetical protein